MSTLQIAQEIRDETTRHANTALKVGTVLVIHNNSINDLLNAKQQKSQKRRL